jgi:hypothetical protein
VGAPGAPPSTDSLRGALRLPALPNPTSVAGDDSLAIRAEPMGTSTPGPAMAALVWLEGRAARAAAGSP